MKSVKSGSWFDPSVWEGGKVPAETDSVEVLHDLTYDKNIIRRGESAWKMRTATIKAVGVIESNFVANTDVPETNGVGIWIMENATIDWQGEYKTSWTRAVGSIVKGAASFTVKDATGWKVNDELVIYPTDNPGIDTFNWNDALNKPEDKFIQKFERRRIKSISGNTVTVNAALLFDHLQFKGWTAEIVNNTSNVKIGGTPTGRSHLLIKSAKPQHIEDVEFEFMGPRGGGQRPGIIVGRYPIHFHHCGNGSRGSRIINNRIHDTGNRGIVVHGSHGVTVENNAVTFFMNNAYWYDPGHVTNDLVYMNNIAGGVVYNGEHTGNTEGFLIGQGDNNVFEGNVAVYCKAGAPGIGGGFSWNTNNEGIPIFKNNLSHSNTTGLFVWQNTGHFHLIVDHESYNEDCGIFWGAYINSYLLLNCMFYNAFIIHKATPGSNAPMYEKCTFDGANKLSKLIDVLSSAVPAGVPIGFRECVFKDYTDAAVEMNTVVHDIGVNTPKAVDFILSTFTGKMWKFAPTSLFGSYFRNQPVAGQPQRFDQKGTVNIAPFAPYKYGTGEGLTGEYYNGSNFQTLAFKRVDSMIKFQGWRKDIHNSPNGVHYLINGEVFSVRWTGFIEPHYSEEHTFLIESWGGIRLWINGELLLDAWTEYSDRVLRPAKPIILEAGKKYAIKMEHFNASGDMGCLLYWKSKSMNENKLIPMSQLYPVDTVAPPPPPPVFKSIRKEKSFTRNNCPEGQTGESYTYVVEAGKYESTVSQSDADAKADTDINTNGQTQANLLGTCKIITMPDPCTTFNAQDYLDLQPDVKAAGYTVDNAIKHYEKYGKTEKRRANKLCLDPTLKPALTTDPDPQPTEKLLFTLKVYDTGRTEKV